MAFEGRAAVAEAKRLRGIVTELDGIVATRESEARYRLDALRRAAAVDELKRIGVERLRDVTDGRLTVQPLIDHGVANVAEVLALSNDDLDRIPGIGPATATQITAAATQIERAAAASVRVAPDPDRRDAADTALVAALRGLIDAQQTLPDIAEDLQLTARIGDLIEPASATTKGVRFFFTRGSKREAAQTALGSLEAALAQFAGSGASRRLDDAHRQLSGAQPSPEQLWADYLARSPDYLAALGELGAAGLNIEAAHGFLPADIADRVEAHALDTSLLNVSLRGYQSFGARFALVQRRVVLGDEMGLGKTIQALALMAHLRANGETHFAVVCPASVLYNWDKELRQRSKLDAIIVHGDDRMNELREWDTGGGVLVTTFDGLRALPLVRPRIAALVVDEAHYVKNPATKRSQAVQQWCSVSDHAVFMTGTPMENRVDEFQELVRHLRPEVASLVSPAAGAAGAVAFRQSVAPVYLRRNQDDVLTELPDRIDSEEWVDLTPTDRRVYRDAVIEGNFMAMRRAATLGAPGSDSAQTSSAKLDRLDELIADAAEGGLKVLVFSFFRDVLAAVVTRYDAVTLGPIDGRVAPDERQRIVDEFTSRPGHAVLIAQIQAGGVGLNIQAASVVVLMEPQWKPSAEEQAIARSHRMGQTRAVRVHRLIAKDSVDERMVEILAQKAALFDAFARESAIKEASDEAVDIASLDGSVAEAARAIIETERRRLDMLAS